MNTPPVLDHLSDLATATGQDVADSAVLRGAHDVGVRVADGLVDSAGKLSEQTKKLSKQTKKLSKRANKQAATVSRASKQAGKRVGQAANQASQVVDRRHGSTKPRARTWFVIGLAVLLAAGAGTVVARRRAGGANPADASPVADPR